MLIGTLAVFACATVTAVAATLGARAVALRLGIVDHPGESRKVHRRPVARLGGPAIFIAVLTPLLVLPGSLAFGALRGQAGLLLGLLLGAAVALGTGIVDDAWGLRARWKLLLQTLAASVAVAGGVGVSPAGGALPLHAAVPVSIFWLVCCMNGVNLIDGLDGLAAGACFLACGALCLVGATLGQPLAVLLAASLGGAVLGFLRFNFRPASIFLGDSGSLLLGFLVGVISLLATAGAPAPAAHLIPVVVLGLPLLDMTLAVLRRWARGLPLFAPDRKHVHHVLLECGLGHGEAVLVLWAACGLLGGAALLLTLGQPLVTAAVIGSLAAAALGCVRFIGEPRLGEVRMRLFRAREARVITPPASSLRPPASSLRPPASTVAEGEEEVPEFASSGFFDPPVSAPYGGEVLEPVD